MITTIPKESVASRQSFCRNCNAEICRGAAIVWGVIQPQIGESLAEWEMEEKLNFAGPFCSRDCHDEYEAKVQLMDERGEI